MSLLCSFPETSDGLGLATTNHPIELLDLGSDLALRRRWFVPDSFAHPAKVHLGLLSFLVDRYTQPGETIADPMAGIGSILLAAASQRHVMAREIEPRWLSILRQNAAQIQQQAGLFAGDIDIGQADARQPWTFSADHIIFSPPYGNEASSSPLAHRALRYRQLGGRRWQSLLARAHEQAGAWGEITFQAGSWGSMTFHYGTHPDQIGHWRGERYWQAMTTIYTHAREALRGGYLMIVVKDHINGGQRVETTARTIALCESLGFTLHAHYQRRVFPLSLWQRRRKERGEPIVEEEDALIFRHATTLTISQERTKA